MTRRGAVALAVALAVTGCRAPAPVPPPDTVGIEGVSTTLPVTPTAVSAAPAGEDTDTITDRFATVIWPTVVGYHYHPAQNGPEQLRWLAVIDPALDQAAWSDLRQAVASLGNVGPPDSEGAVSGGVDTLTLASTALTEKSPTDATITACYTFTARTYTLDSGVDPIRTPAAAAADFALVRTDTWYLHSITHQHAVPGC